jgi:hypothetical protein
MKITQIVESKITIYFARVKNDLSNVEDRRQTVYIESQMNRILQNQEDIEECLSIKSIVIHENSRHVSHILITFCSNEFFY